MTTFFSVDVETTGPCPAVADLLTVGAVAIHENPDGTIREVIPDVDGTADLFYGRIAEPRNGWRWDSDTLAWWRTQHPSVYAEAVDVSTGTERVSRIRLAADFEAWIVSQEPDPNQRIFVANPAGFDWQWVNELFWSTLHRNPFGYRSLCLRSMAYGLRGGAWGRDRTDDEFNVASAVPHHALYDAIAQAETFLRLYQRANGLT